MTTIAALQLIFAVEGLPCTIVSDNGTQFTSCELKEFYQHNAIKHLTTAPFHPASNGLAERGVRTIKEAFKKIMQDDHNTERALYKYLATYRATPNPITGKSPAEMLHGRQPRTVLAALFPSAAKTTENNSKFAVGEKVSARNYSGSQRWIAGKILLGNKMYSVETEKGVIRRHQNQIRAKKK